MKLIHIALGILLVILVVSVHDLLADPYYHKERVNFWTWCKRELTELKEGEKA